MNRELQYIISGISALIITGLLLIFMLLPLDEPIPIQPVGEEIDQIQDGDSDGEETPPPQDLMRLNGARLQVSDNLTAMVVSLSFSAGSSSGNQGSGGNGGGGGGGGSTDRIPPTVTGIFSRPPDTSNGWYTHPFNVTWIGQDERSGIDFCDPPTNYSGPDGSSLVLQGHCTDKAGNVGTGHVTFSYNTTRFFSFFSYDLRLNHGTINLGSSISATATTNDTSIVEVAFVWRDAQNNTKASNIRHLSSDGAAQDSFIPDSQGQWKVDAHFTDLAVRTKLFLVNPAGGGSNHAPVATNDVITTLEDHPVVINVLANDSDPDGDSLVISSFKQAGKGSVTRNPSGTLIYTPIQNFNGHDSFSYRISDGPLQSANSATVRILVTPVNDAPIANAGPDQTVKETSKVGLSGAASSDVDGDTLTYSWDKIDGPSVNLNNAHSISPSFTAPLVTKDTVLTFELSVTDGFGGSSTDTVKIKVLNINGNGGGDDDCDDDRKHKHKGGDDDNCNGGGHDDKDEHDDKDNGNDKGASHENKDKEKENGGNDKQDDDNGNSNNEDRDGSRGRDDDDDKEKHKDDEKQRKK